MRKVDEVSVGRHYSEVVIACPLVRYSRPAACLRPHPEHASGRETKLQPVSQPGRKVFVKEQLQPRFALRLGSIVILLLTGVIPPRYPVCHGEAG